MNDTKIHNWNTYVSNLKDFDIHKIYSDSVKLFNEELQNQNKPKILNKYSGSSVLKMYKYYHNLFKKCG